MEEVTVSSKYQVLIPLRVRKILTLKPGQKTRVILFENRVELIPLRPIQEARGSLRGIDTTIERDTEEHGQRKQSSGLRMSNSKGWKVSSTLRNTMGIH